MRSTIIIAAILATGLAGCGKKDDKPTAVATAPEKGMPLSDFQKVAKQRGGKPEVMRMMAVVGRWESQPGAVAHMANRRIVLTVSSDNQFTLALLGRDGGATMDTVDIDVRGPISWTADGILSGSGKGARPPLDGFDTWRASFPKTGAMTLKGSSGKSYELTYRGI